VTKLVQIKEPINDNFEVVFVCEENWHCILPVDDTRVPKYIGEAHSIFLLIKKVNLVGIRKGVR
jgi:hypothetical protein